MRPRLLLGLWCGTIAGALWVLHRAGRGELAAPPASPRRWPAWAEAAGPSDALAAALRLVGLGLGWYLAGATAVGLLARATGWVRPGRLAARALPLLAPVLLGSGGSLTLSAADLPGGLAVADGPVLDAGGTSEAPATPGAAASEPPPTATLERIDFELAPLPQPTPALDQWEIRAGDHLWLVAREVLIDVSGVEPCEREIARYWRRLIDHNRDRLVVPDNPDLVYPGQVLELPAPEGPDQPPGL